MIGDRIKKIIKDSGKTIVEFAKITGVSKNSVINYRDNIRSPDTNFIRAVCLNFRVSSEWLLFGTGDIYKEPDKSPLNEEEKEALRIDDSIQISRGSPEIKGLRQEVFLWNHYGEWVVKFIDDAILESGIAPQILEKSTKNMLIAIVKDDIEINMKARVIDFLRRFEKQKL